ncbi:hypothetical protein JCM15519_38360 [Fundidesulfovibrio butyratiphilus]
MDTPSTTAARLKFIRGKRTQAEFAQVAGIHKNTLGRYERGESEPDLVAARQICLAFGVEPKWLLFGDGPVTVGSDQTTPAPNATTAIEPAGVDPTSEINALRQENRELRGENRELRQENRELLKQNADLRVELARLEARAAPDKGSTEVMQDESARKIA